MKIYTVVGARGMGSVELWEGQELVALFALPSIKFNPKNADRMATRIADMLNKEEQRKWITKMGIKQRSKRQQPTSNTPPPYQKTNDGQKLPATKPQPNGARRK